MTASCTFSRTESAPTFGDDLHYIGYDWINCVDSEPGRPSASFSASIHELGDSVKFFPNDEASKYAPLSVLEDVAAAASKALAPFASEWGNLRGMDATFDVSNDDDSELASLEIFPQRGTLGAVGHAIWTKVPSFGAPSMARLEQFDWGSTTKFPGSYWPRDLTESKDGQSYQYQSIKPSQEQAMLRMVSSAAQYPETLAPAWFAADRVATGYRLPGGIGQATFHFVPSDVPLSGSDQPVRFALTGMLLQAKGK